MPLKTAQGAALSSRFDKVQALRLSLFSGRWIAVCAFIEFFKTPFFGFQDRPDEAVCCRRLFVKMCGETPLNLMLSKQTFIA